MAPSFSRCSSALLMVAMCVASAAALSTTAEERNAALFASFKSRFNKTYPGAAAEATRYEIFVANLARAAEHGKANPKAKFGVNAYSDLTEEEFRRTHRNAAPRFKDMMARRPAVAPLFTQEQVSAAATSIDWRTKGAVTYVKNQGQCGSCWSFSSTGSIEAQWFLAGNTLVALSEQELVSCDTTDDGCQGGLMDNAWAWLISNQGGAIVTEASYPYVSGTGTVPACALPKTKGATINGHEDLPQNEAQMATWMSTNGPISIGVDATSWQTYTSGIMTNCISSQVDHGVLAVGFDDTNSPPYWIIKNSWGATWGESGYIRVQKGTDQCLITSNACSSKVGSGPGPVPPSPPATPTPNTPPTPPTPSGKTFTQYVCQDFFCTSGCQGNTFNQDVCLQTENGGSAIVTCGSELKIKSYTSTDCSGSSSTTSEPIDQCLADTAGTYVYNACSSSSATAKLSAAKMQLRRA